MVKYNLSSNFFNKYQLISAINRSSKVLENTHERPYW